MPHNPNLQQSLQWVRVFSGSESLVGASVSGCQSSVGAHTHDIEADSHVRAPTCPTFRRSTAVLAQADWTACFASIKSLAFRRS
jgi:hypothetical protein